MSTKRRKSIPFASPKPETVNRVKPDSNKYQQDDELFFDEFNFISQNQFTNLYDNGVKIKTSDELGRVIEAVPGNHKVFLQATEDLINTVQPKKQKPLPSIWEIFDCFKSKR